MHDAQSFLQNLALVFCVAALTTVVFHRLKQPIVFGYLLKGTSIEEVVAAVRGAVDGEPRFSPPITAGLLQLVREMPPPRGLPGGPRLSQRELQVLRLIADGEGNPEIARSLGISEQTVKTHVSAILEKLGVGNRIQAAVYAVRSGIE